MDVMSMMDSPWMLALLVISMILLVGGLFMAMRVFGSRAVGPDHPDDPSHANRDRSSGDSNRGADGTPKGL